MRFFLLCVALTLLPGRCFARTSADPKPTTQYFIGKSFVSLPDGGVVGETKSLIKRKLWPEEGLIVEDICTVDPRGQERPQRFVVIMRVRGNSVKMVELNDAFHGTGQLSGPKWAWTGWKTESRLAEGGRLVSEDELKGDTLKVRKQLFGEDGRLKLLIRESFPQVSAQEYRDQLPNFR